MVDERWCGAPIKFIAMALLTIQNSSLTLLMRYSRSEPAEKQYLPSTCVITTEAAKLLVSVFLLRRERGDDSTTGTPANKDFDLVEMGKSAIPAALYVVQNNLAFVALQNLDAVLYQVVSQGKILTTALFSMLILGKTFNKSQWASILLLFVGIVVVQFDDIKKAAGAAGASSTGGNHAVGMLAVVGMLCCSAGAGVYFEKILKGSPVSIWARNCHLAGIGIVSGLGGIAMTADLDIVLERGFFHGYRPLTWSIVALLALGGLLIAVVIKHADSMMKCFATSMAIIVSCVVSIIFLHFELTVSIAVGTVMVNAAVHFYSQASAPAPAVAAVKVQPEGGLADDMDADDAGGGCAGSATPADTDEVAARLLGGEAELQ
jgi:UDP-sugar transporter A1/2/3